MPWEIFDPGPNRRATSTPYVTIYPGRPKVCMNPAAMLALGNPRRVLLLFDPAARVLGLRAADAEDRNAFRVGPKTRQVNVEGLFAHYGLTVDVARRRRAELVEGVLCIDLTVEGRAVGRRRVKVASRSGE